jgi:predicted metal-dependent phosphoesterase TrpH
MEEESPTPRVDLHVHSCYSRDSLSSLEAIIAACKRRGIDRIALTDHGTIQGALALQRIAPHLVIVGQEIKTTAGELIAYFVREEVPQGLSPAEAIRQLREQGAVVGVSHPLDRIRREAMGLEAVLQIADQLDCMETFNARCLWVEDNWRAAALASEQNLPGTAGSDAHHVVEIGRTYVEMPDFDDRVTFLQGLREARIVGRSSGLAVHFLSTYAKLRKRGKG